jgi:hypothetical protein
MNHNEQCTESVPWEFLDCGRDSEFQVDAGQKHETTLRLLYSSSWRKWHNKRRESSIIKKGVPHYIKIMKTLWASCRLCSLKRVLS